RCAVQPLCRGAVDARVLRADDRPAALEARQEPLRQGLLDDLPADRGLRDRLDGQPLPLRRVPRRVHGRRLGLRGVVAGPGAPDGLGVHRPARRGLMAVRPAPRERVRNALIESRLTPNGISMTGLVLNVAAAVLIWQRYFFIGG